jgi:hypothetical protein
MLVSRQFGNIASRFGAGRETEVEWTSGVAGRPAGLHDRPDSANSRRGNGGTGTLSVPDRPQIAKEVVMTEPEVVRHELATARARIDRLERRQRRWAWCVLGVAVLSLALAGGAGIRGSSAQGDVVIARQVGIVDPSGRQRAVMGVVEGVGPALVFYSAQGEAQMMLAGQDVGPSLYLYDSNRKLRVRLELNEAIGPSLVLSDPAGRQRTVLAVVQETPRLSLFNVDGEAFWKTP